jgi:hypothetical protein
MTDMDVDPVNPFQIFHHHHSIPTGPGNTHFPGWLRQNLVEFLQYLVIQTSRTARPRAFFNGGQSYPVGFFYPFYNFTTPFLLNPNSSATWVDFHPARINKYPAIRIPIQAPGIRSAKSNKVSRETSLWVISKAFIANPSPFVFWEKDIIF